MPIPLLTDKEKLDKWNDICIMHEWSRGGELTAWLYVNNVKFTPGESVLSPDGMTLRIAAPDAAKGLVVGPSGETMATHILSVYIGKITFASTGIEAVFWHEVIERMSREFNTFMPPDLIPAYIRDTLKYPQDGGGELPT